MSEQTRKTLAMWLIGGGLVWGQIYNYLIWPYWVAPILNNYNMYGSGYNVLGLDTQEFLNMIGFLNLFLKTLLFLSGYLVLKKILNRVTKMLFNRFWIMYLICFLLQNTIREIEIVYLGLAIVAYCYGISGVGAVLQNYRLDKMMADKLMLIQAGMVYGVFIQICVYISWLSSGYMGVVLMSNRVTQLLDISTTLFMIFGFVGVIKSDLIGEGRKTEVFSAVKNGLWSRPVIGVLCGSVFVIAGFWLMFE